MDWHWMTWLIILLLVWFISNFVTHRTTKKKIEDNHRIHSCLAEFDVTGDNIHIVIISDDRGLFVWADGQRVFTYSGDSDVSVMPTQEVRTIGRIAVWKRNYSVGDKLAPIKTSDDFLAEN